LSAPEKELIAAAKSGDGRALSGLLERYQPTVYRFGLRVCRDEADAEDVLQDTLLTMTRDLGDFREKSSLSTWLFAIARSHCIKRRRRSRHAPEELEPLDVAARIADGARPPDELLAGKRIEKALEEAIGALDPKYREVLILRDAEGLTAPEVAETLGIGVAAVKSRLHRARRAVRTALEGLDAPA